MISFKIWRICAEVDGYSNTGNMVPRRKGSRVVLVIVESGLSLFITIF